jgi:hypothetical protein
VRLVSRMPENVREVAEAKAGAVEPTGASEFGAAEAPEAGAQQSGRVGGGR